MRGEHGPKGNGEGRAEDLPAGAHSSPRIRSRLRGWPHWRSAMGELCLYARVGGTNAKGVPVLLQSWQLVYHGTAVLDIVLLGVL